MITDEQVQQMMIFIKLETDFIIKAMTDARDMAKMAAALIDLHTETMNANQLLSERISIIDRRLDDIKKLLEGKWYNP